jgi:hypothetical protein
MKEGEYCMHKKIIHEMFKCDLKNISTKISISYHISNDENHLHSENHYTHWTFDLFPCQKIFKIQLLSSKIKIEQGVHWN